ncbi:MAG: DUF1559 domain-containing protein, partial [Planctomycetota bacterium]
VYGLVTTILPPNRELVMGDAANSSGAMPPSSRHPGGCHVMMGDGAVKFVTDSIEAGDESNPSIYANAQGTSSPAPFLPGTRSPFGLWGALGSRAALEIIDEEF